MMKSTMEVLNDTTAALSARSRGSEEKDELSRRTSTPSGKEKENAPGVFLTKMGMAAQFSGPSRLNVPEEEVIIVKKRETKNTDAAEPNVQAKPNGSGHSRPIPNLDDSFEDVEEIPFLEDNKPDAKGKDEQEEKRVEHEDDPDIVIESKRGPLKPALSRSPSCQGDIKSEHKDTNIDEEKEDGEEVLRRNATHEDIYDELRKMKRGSRSPRDDEHIGSEHEHDTSRSSSFDKKDKVSTNSDESTKDQSSREDRESRDRDREKSREKRKERRRSKQDEPKKLQVQVSGLCS